MSFTGKTIVVTGAAGGLGRACVAHFAAAGGRVVVADLAESEGSDVAQSLGAAARFLPLDVTREEDWSNLLDIVDQELGGLDVLVNNAGFYRPNVSFEEMELDLWRKHFAINSDGCFLGCKHGIRRMKQRGGAIVNIGSGMSIKHNPTGAAYCASKAAVLMTTRAAAGSAGRYGIRVNAVLPGAVVTSMLLGSLKPGDDEQEFLDRIARGNALGRLATPSDIAKAVLFLADDSNAAVTGVYLPVDGGDMPGA